jgi:hypothetical protein
MFLHQHFHKYSWTYLDGKAHNQIDDMSIDRKWHSSIHIYLMCDLSGEGAECDYDPYLVVSKAREILAVSKQAAQNWMWRDLISGS